ncbi:site-specific recombinase XerC [Rhizobium sp. BK176]|nr:site-specific recombinase XerC [Rhizobium sp. BK661]MCS4093987.1 site-specific recombinase XerC [Rhizobium sp. BK176]
MRIVYAREPRKLPVVLSTNEVVRFLEAVPGLKARAALTIAYAAGLRVSEVVNLKVGDIDSDWMVIRVVHGKGGKDRYVPCQMASTGSATMVFSPMASEASRSPSAGNCCRPRRHRLRFVPRHQMKIRSRNTHAPAAARQW